MKPSTIRKTKPRSMGKKRPDEGIYAVYLYYFPRSGPVRIYETWDVATVVDPETEIKRLADNAAVNGKTPPFVTNDSSKMMMRRRSYVAFAVSARDYTFGTSNAVKFTGFDHFHGKIDGFHTFFNPVSLAFATTATAGNPSQPLLLVYYENHMISSLSSKKLAYKEGETFIFDLPFLPLSISRRLRAPDSGGTNMGPPVPPPARRIRTAGRPRKKTATN